jgi:hypothetical protein
MSSGEGKRRKPIGDNGPDVTLVGRGFVRHSQVKFFHSPNTEGMSRATYTTLVIDEAASLVKTEAKKPDKLDRAIEDAMSSLGWFNTTVGRSSRIERPPGMRLDRLAQLLPKRTYERVLRPCLADMQKEYFDALLAGDERAAKVACFWGVVAFWRDILALILVEPLIKIALKLRT